MKLFVESVHEIYISWSELVLPTLCMAASLVPRPSPLHHSQIAHIVRLICDARLPLHLGRKNFSPPDDGGLRISSVRVFPEVESDVTAYLLHFRFGLRCVNLPQENHPVFRSPMFLCIGKPASKPPPQLQPHQSYDPPPVRWPSTESADQPYAPSPPVLPHPLTFLPGTIWYC
jgi:hypothetical protein